MNGSRYATARFIARALDDLGQEHLPRAEEIADDRHPVHQRPFDDVEGARGCRSRLLGVLLDEVDDPVDERVREALTDRGLAPGEIDFSLGRAARHGPGAIHEPLGRVRPAVEEHALDSLEEVGLDVLVDGELAGIDDPHVEPGADRVVEERRMHRLSDGVVSAEREREIRDAARDQGARASRLEQRDRLDVPLRELRVLLDPRRHREHVRVEHDVFGPEAGLADQ